MNQSIHPETTKQCGTGNLRSRIVHIHPTLQCNLSCKHCYSGSLPSHTRSLDIGDLKQFLQAAFREGYNTVSVSGGEPFLYKNLGELLQFTKQTGFKNVVASNGMLLDRKASMRILDSIDVIALSIDGKPELHNKIRCSERAFKKLLDGIEVIKSKDLSFGFIHTVTNQSWDSILWLAEFAHQHGAKLLQLHPLEMHGRAVNEMQGFGLDQTTLHKVFLLAAYLKSKYEPGMFIQLDLLHKEYIKAMPQSVNVRSDSYSETNLSGALDTIVVDEHGDIVPVGYGFSKKYRIGNIRPANNGYEHMFRQYLHNTSSLLNDLFEKAYQKIIHNEKNDLVNWNELIIRWSHNLV